MKNSLPRMKNRIDAREHAGDVVVQVVLGSDLDGALIQEDQQRGEEDHHKGIELGQPCYDDGSKPRPPAVLMEMVWLAPDTARKPAIPHTAPDTTMVRMMTWGTLMAA